MLVKRFLILAPFLLMILLLQSYFWVPSYEEQTRGNPKRLQEFITASIGDASILNPILSADTASSDIQSKVFEGLIDLGRNLDYRGRLARSWEISERAFFYVNPESPIPGQGVLNPGELVRFLQDQVQDAHEHPQALQSSLENIAAISLETPPKYERQRSVVGAADPVVFAVEPPARVVLQLREVDPDLFEHLTGLLGKDYFESFPAQRYVTADPALTPDRLATLVQELLPALEHNPVIVFHLRDQVRFHDGHLFDAGDVKFTYESIINPKNLSPRVADYEPVKTVQAVDRLTVKIVYKRLYSPALMTWSIGILPEHLLNRQALDAEARSRRMDPAKFFLRDSRFNRNPVGCGPFRFESWESDQFIRLAKAVHSSHSFIN